MQNSVSSHNAGSSNQHVTQYQHELFDQCRSTFEAFQGLGDVAEDMRILSLNAELAAGRAGTYGVSIRALTQYTRELVNRLEQINLEMRKVDAFKAEEEAEGDAAPTPKAEAIEYDETEYSEHEYTAEGDEGYYQEEYDQGQYDEHAHEEENSLSALIHKFEEENGGVKYLNEQAKRIAEVVSQSNSIATNMAIEAATAGQYEDTFTNVANDMRGFVNTLKNMVTRAQDSIEKAFRAEKSLREIDAIARQ